LHEPLLRIAQVFEIMKRIAQRGDVGIIQAIELSGQFRRECANPPLQQAKDQIALTLLCPAGVLNNRS